MALYTFIMEFAGGTYMSQVEASSPESACVKWAEKLDVSEIYGLGLKGKNFLLEEMKANSPVALEGLLNAWCTSSLIQGKSALINLVQTEQSEIQ